MEEIKELGFNVVVVSFAPMDRLSGYIERLKLPFPVFSDESRKLYQAFELRRGSFFQVWNLRALKRYKELLSKGRKLQKPAEEDDLYQLGGDFLLGKSGAIIYRYPSRGPEDRPSAEVILNAVRSSFRA